MSSLNQGTDGQITTVFEIAGANLSNMDSRVELYKPTISSRHEGVLTIKSDANSFGPSKCNLLSCRFSFSYNKLAIYNTMVRKKGAQFWFVQNNRI